MSGVVLNFLPCRSYDEFVDLDKRLQITAQNVGFEVGVSRPYEAAKGAFSFQGYCSLCEKNTTFHVDWTYASAGFEDREPTRLQGGYMPCWRERTHCSVCGENSRNRALMQMVMANLDRTDVIHMAEYGSGTFRQMAKRFPLLIGSEFFSDGTKPGEYSSSFVRFEDLTNLSFPDNSLNASISSEVFEHIPNYKKAIKELYRVLKPGGKALLTAPFRADRAQTTIRATIDDDGEITHHLEPEYHGSRAGDVLCFQHFGWDIIETFREEGFGDAAAYLFWNPSTGNMGAWDFGFDVLIMATKESV